MNDTGQDDTEQFIDNLIDSMNRHDLTPEIRAQLKEDLLGDFTDALNQAILATLTPTQMAEVERLVDNEQYDQLPAYLDSQGVDRQGVVARVAADFRNSYIGTNQ